MNYKIVLIFSMPFIVGSADRFSAEVSKFKYFCEKKKPDKMREVSIELRPLLEGYAKDDCKDFNPSSHGQTIESLHTLVKLLGSKKDVPLYKDWLLSIKPGTKSILETREQIFDALYPTVKVLHKAVQKWADSVEADGGNATSVDDSLTKAAIRASAVQRNLLFCKDSKLNAGGGKRVFGFNKIRNNCLN